MLSPSLADSVANSYEGKTITIQVDYGADGGYDTNTRMFARYFGNYVPGNPTIFVQNVPGTGSMKVANQIWNVAAKDGTVLGVFASSTALEPLFGNDKAAFDQHVKSGDFKIIAQFGSGTKVPYFGDATPLYEMMKTEDDKKILNLVFRQTELARPLAPPPGTPKDRVTAMRKAMLEALKDPGLIADAKKAGFSFDPVPAGETIRLFNEWYSTPKPLLTRARDVTQSENSK